MGFRGDCMAELTPQSGPPGGLGLPLSACLRARLAALCRLIGALRASCSAALGAWGGRGRVLERIKETS